MSKLVVNTVEQYRLLIDGDLLDLVRQCIALQQAVLDSEEYSDKRDALENKLYDLYEEVGWSVVYEMNELPF